MTIELSIIGARIEELKTERDLMLKYLDLRKQLNDMHGVMDASADIREMDARIDELEKLRKAYSRFVPVETLPIQPMPMIPSPFDPVPEVPSWPGILPPDFTFDTKK